MKTLLSQIKLLIESPANTNETCLTVSPEHGWNVSFNPGDREAGAIVVLFKDELNAWAEDAEWNEEMFSFAEGFIRDNLVNWLGETLTLSQINALL